MAEELKLGDRIVVLDEQSNWRGHHGTIIGGASDDSPAIMNGSHHLYKARLDNLHYFETSTATHFRKEKEGLETVPGRAPVFHGVVDPRTPTTGSVVGAAIIRCFETMRRIAATRTKELGESYREEELSFEQRMDLNQRAILEWNNGIYTALIRELSDDAGSAAERRILLPALHSPDAIGSWKYGFVGHFWLVGRDQTGNYVIPADTIQDDMGLLVYKIVGIRNTVIQPQQQPSHDPLPPIQMLRNPIRMRLCIVPWYGRLLYDSSLTPDSIQTAHDNPNWTKRLQLVVMRAYYQKVCRVIDRWMLSEI